MMSMLHNLDPAQFLDNACIVIMAFHGVQMEFFHSLHNAHSHRFVFGQIFKDQLSEASIPKPEAAVPKNMVCYVHGPGARLGAAAMKNAGIRKTLCVIRDAAFVVMDLAFTRGHIELAQCIRRHFWQPLAILCRPEGE